MSSGLPGPKVRIALGGRSRSGRGQRALAVEGDLVLVEAAGLEALDPDQRVVVARRPRRSARVRPRTSTSQGSLVSTQIVASVSET